MLYYAGYVLTISGAADEAVRLYDRAIDSARARGDQIVIGGATLFRGVAELYRGDLAAAEEDLLEAREVATFRQADPYITSFLAQVLIERGRLAEAEEVLAGAGLPERIPANGHLIFFLEARGRARRELHRVEEAARDFLALGEMMEQLGIRNPAFLPWRSQAALALHMLDRSEEARSLAAEEVELTRRWGVPATIGMSLRVLGLVTGGRDGERTLREAVEVLDAAHARLEHARALVDLGAALRRGKQRSEAKELLRQGLDFAHRAGATGLAERAQAELAATGARPRSLVVSGVDSLTPSERRVAELAAEHMTNKDIAQALFVTPKTVEVHLSNVYRKLGIASRNELPGALGARTAAPAA
jgi:DNA-binding CsgD family transcriptional regulator